MGIGHWALVLNVPLRGSKLRVASRREAEVLGIGHWALGIGYSPRPRVPASSNLPSPHAPSTSTF
ncbi:hypothetical protein H6H03_06850 [Nostoc paludosum FACHB-159]|uniref:Uncharacterized protein n=1 Tax=Nostoc paludosum FACHB-159 TaxID=2692908 RepID=A0ABR8K628_9NOSO|nr:hypothetical protein [Nostoc paludosum FACHB-159]